MENEEIKKEELGMTTVKGFGELQSNSNTEQSTFSNITDKKKLFNVQNKVDNLLNDCEGEIIRVKEIMIKRYLKPMKEPIVDEETGEILKDKEMTMSVVLIDDNGKSYATGSKMFGIQLMRYLQMFATNEGFDPFEIKIVKIQQQKGKSLGFELV